MLWRENEECIRLQDRIRNLGVVPYPPAYPAGRLEAEDDREEGEFKGSINPDQI